MCTVLSICECRDYSFYWMTEPLTEVGNPGTGLTRGSVVLSFLQWFGRSNVLFLILQSIPEVLPHTPLSPRNADIVSEASTTNMIAECCRC